MRNSPTLSPEKAAERKARQERLAQALRENLRRRKEQGAARRGPAAGLSGTAPSGKSRRRSEAPGD
jgi:hypothetical protein